MTFAAADCTGNVIEFSLGTLDTPSGRTPDAHIYTAWKADWHSINDDLASFPEGRS